MSFIVIVVGIVALLFGLAFVAKRRFGMLGLALIAGATLSQLWASTLTSLIEHVGITLTAPPLESVVAAGLIVLPALALLLGGRTYHKTTSRLIGAAAFALLATTLLLDPLGGALVIDGTGKGVYAALVHYHAVIITAGIIVAILELATTRPPKPIVKH